MRASPHVAARHRVSGLMLANHTGVRHTLDKTLAQFDKLMERKVGRHQTVFQDKQSYFVTHCSDPRVHDHAVRHP